MVSKQFWISFIWFFVFEVIALILYIYKFNAIIPLIIGFIPAVLYILESPTHSRNDPNVDYVLISLFCNGLISFFSALGELLSSLGDLSE